MPYYSTVQEFSTESTDLCGPREKVGVFDVKICAFDVMIPDILKSSVQHGVMQCVHGVTWCIHRVMQCVCGFVPFS
jgi:hypothetical protein